VLNIAILIQYANIRASPLKNDGRGIEAEANKQIFDNVFARRLCINCE
jgi:hypothetical protein